MKFLSHLYRSSGRKKGLTLIEILVVLVILSIIVTSLFVVFKAGLDSWRRTQNRLEVFQSARQAIDMMTRDLKAAYINANNGAITFQGYAAGATGWVTPTIASDTEVFFIAALNPALNDPNANFELCQVGYWRNSNTNELMRYYFYQIQGGAAQDYNFSANAGNAAFNQKVADNVSGFTLNFFDEVGNITPAWNSTNIGNPNMFRRKPAKVEITLTVQEPNSTPVRFQTFITGVYLPQ